MDDLETLPFLPKEFKYEVIDGVKKQFQIVSGLLNRPDVDTIYVCTDSGREGEYIYRLVDRWQAHVTGQGTEDVSGSIPRRRKRSCVASGKRRICPSMIICAASAYLRAKEDYLMGINFSRVLTLKYGHTRHKLF